MGRVRVLVVDDSALVRRTVVKLLEHDGDLEVVGLAGNGKEALDQIAILKPDVVTLDLEMPVMDGMTCLGHLVRQYQQPVVILSSIAHESAFATFRAIAIGAFDFVTKPSTGSYLTDIERVGAELRGKVRMAARVPRSKVRRRSVAAVESAVPGARSNVAAPKNRQQQRRVENSVPASIAVGIGGSTGGTVALEALLRKTSRDSRVTFLVVQHVPQAFSPGLARYLDGICDLDVKLAEHDELALAGTVYIAEGGAHLRVQRGQGGLRIRLDRRSPERNGFMPSIDTLFLSLAVAQRGRPQVALLLSGMGKDGVEGLRAIHELGGRTLVQDEQSSVVFGMGARAVECGAADAVVPLTQLGGALSDALRVLDEPCQ